MHVVWGPGVRHIPNLMQRITHLHNLCSDSSIEMHAIVGQSYQSYRPYHPTIAYHNVFNAASRCYDSIWLDGGRLRVLTPLTHNYKYILLLEEEKTHVKCHLCHMTAKNIHKIASVICDIQHGNELMLVPLDKSQIYRSTRYSNDDDLFGTPTIKQMIHRQVVRNNKKDFDREGLPCVDVITDQMNSYTMSVKDLLGGDIISIIDGRHSVVENFTGDLTRSYADCDDMAKASIKSMSQYYQYSMLGTATVYIPMLIRAMVGANVLDGSSQMQVALVHDIPSLTSHILTLEFHAIRVSFKIKLTMRRLSHKHIGSTGSPVVYVEFEFGRNDEDRYANYKHCTWLELHPQRIKHDLTEHPVSVLSDPDFLLRIADNMVRYTKPFLTSSTGAHS